MSPRIDWCPELADPERSRAWRSARALTDADCERLLAAVFADARRAVIAQERRRRIGAVVAALLGCCLWAALVLLGVRVAIALGWWA